MWVKSESTEVTVFANALHAASCMPCRPTSQLWLLARSQSRAKQVKRLTRQPSQQRTCNDTMTPQGARNDSSETVDSARNAIIIRQYHCQYQYQSGRPQERGATGTRRTNHAKTGP
eukprot:13654589-Alexandrium_andersonii.AAC.1